MRIERGEHSVDCGRDQLLLIRHLDIVRKDEPERISEEFELTIIGDVPMPFRGVLAPSSCQLTLTAMAMRSNTPKAFALLRSFPTSFECFSLIDLWHAPEWSFPASTTFNTAHETSISSTAGLALDPHANTRPS